MTAFQIADAAIALFIEYRDVHGYDEITAHAMAALEVAEGVEADLGDGPS